MRIVLQRSKNASVSVDCRVVGKIDYGLVVLVGFTQGDTLKEIDYLVKKIINLRIFDDENGVMNKSLIDVGGSVLSISQFTLYGDALNGRRPSYIRALAGKDAIDLYNEFNDRLKGYNINVETGIFGADMEVTFTNDGPVTLCLEKESYDEKK